MHMTVILRKSMGWSAWGAIMLAALAACEPKAAGDPPKEPPPRPDPGPITSDMVGAANALGGVLFRANGDFVVVDAAGKEVAPCRLPDPDRKTDAAADVGECQKVSNTTITNVQSIAVVRHTGSHCIIIGPVQTVSAGGVVTSSGVFQLPPGCTH